MKKETENAKLTQEQIKKLADYAVREGTENTYNGKWSITYDELYYHFGASVTPENALLLKEELDEREEVSDCIIAEDCIEIAYHLEYCPQCRQGGVEGAMSLLSVVGCNIEDEHLKDNEPGIVQTM